MKHIISKEIIQMTKLALEKVGEEEFEELGPDEVINLDEITEKFKKLSLTDKIKISQDLKEYTKCSETLIHILMRIEHDLLEKDEELNLNEITQIAAVGHPNIAEAFSLNDSISGC